MDADLQRYSCQLALPGFGEAAQQKLKNAKVLIVGLGGLGCPAAQYLTSSGIGMLGLADFDTVSISNLHRQILYTPADVGLKKITVACSKLARQNPQIQLISHETRITLENAMEIIKNYDVIVDGTDNFDTRYLLNDACFLLKKPLVYGAIYQYEGQVAVWNVLNEDGSRSVNYRDLFPEVDASQIPNCAEGGVIPTIAGIIGCMQANEVIKFITRTGELLAGKMLILNAETLQSRIIKIGAATKTNITNLPKLINVPTISIHDLKSSLTENRYELIDIRTSKEHLEFNIGGRNISLNELESSELWKPDNKTAVLYCTTGKRSDEALKRILQKHPQANLFSLEGGLKAWLEDRD